MTRSGRHRPARHLAVAASRGISAVAIGAMLATCGTSSSTTSTGASPLPATTSPVAGGTSGSLGAKTTFTSSAGYKYEIRATRAQTNPTVRISGQAQSAPPDKTYITVDVQVQNGTDRAEPLDPVVSASSSALRLAVPTAAMAAFGLTAGDTQYTCLVDREPAGTCVLLTGTAISSVTPADASATSAQIQPAAAGMKVVHLVTSFAVPSSAPLAQVTLYLESSATGPLVQLPLGG